jgi:hypothetical protein
MRKFSILIHGIIIVSCLVLIAFSSGANAFDNKTSDQNSVRVDVKPIQLVPGKPAVFEVRLNTHSVDLGYELAEVSILQDDSGKTYRAASWKGSPPGGHHRTGTLEFPKLEGTPQTVTLIIKGIAGVSERLFEWKLS